MRTAPRRAGAVRERELTVLRGLVEQVGKGGSGSVLIEGEPGIGKTRLLQELLDAARAAGVTGFRGEAHPLERTRPFGALVDALDLRSASQDPRRAAIGRLISGRQESHHRFEVAEEIVDLLEVLSDATPLLVAIEDLHWADNSTLLAFRWMLARLDHVPLLLAATLRPSPRGRDLAQVVDGALAAGATPIALAPLDEEEVASLVRAELGRPPGPVLEQAVARAGGNPLWIVELLRSCRAEGVLDVSEDGVELAADELPESLRQLVLRRLGLLPDATVALLPTAAILGTSFSLVDLATVTGGRAADLSARLREAFHAGLVGEQGGAIVFRHALVHEAIYRAIPVPVRVALHRDAGRALAAAAAPLEEVAGHVYLGAVTGDAEAVELLRRAAGEVAPRAPGVAVDLLRRAESLLPDRHPSRDRVLVELVDALLRAGEVAQAAATAEGVLARTHDDGADVPLRLLLLEALSLQNRPTDLIAQGRAALAKELEPGQEALVLAQTSYGHTFSGDPAAGEEASRRALAVAEAAGDRPMTVWALATLTVAVRMQGRCDEALAVTGRALAAAFEPPDEQARLRHPWFFRGLALSDADRLDEAAEAYRRAIAESAELGSAWLLPDTRLMAAELRFLRGEWDDAVLELEAGLEAAAEQGAAILVAQSRAYLAVIAAARGDVRAAEAALADVPEAPDAYGAELVAWARGMLHEAAGRADAALDVLLLAHRRAQASGITYYHRHLGPPIVRLALGLGEEGVAREVCADLAGGSAVPTVQAAALRCRGLLARDAELLLRAVELARGGGRVLDRIGACEDAAAVVGGAEGRDLLEEALDCSEALGAAGIAARAGWALRALGGRRGPRGPRAATGLTPSERAVAELVAQGLTNREVAARLYVSPHTVNSHLRRIFQKLGVPNRAALAAKLHSIE